MYSHTKASNVLRLVPLAILWMMAPAFAADVVITSEQKGADVISLGYVEFRRQVRDAGRSIFVEAVQDLEDAVILFVPGKIFFRHVIPPYTR